MARIKLPEEPAQVYGYCQGCKRDRLLTRIAPSRFRCDKCASKEARGIRTSTKEK